jgi:hypothetical protein
LSICEVKILSEFHVEDKRMSAAEASLDVVGDDVQHNPASAGGKGAGFQQVGVSCPGIGDWVCFSLSNSRQICWRQRKEGIQETGSLNPPDWLDGTLTTQLLDQLQDDKG